MRALVKIAAVILATCSTLASAAETITYTYDARGRLIDVSRSGSVNNGIASCYALDQADNRTNVTVATSACTVTPTASFSIGDAIATEGSSLVFTVTKTGSPGSSLNVDYATANGSATAGSDYTTVSGTLTFTTSDTTKTITVPTTNDAAVEGAENLFVNLTNPTSGAVLADYHATGTLNDDDQAPLASFAISDASVTEGGSLVFTVTKTGSTPNSILLYYSTANGTAFAGTDFVFTDALVTIVFGPAETSKMISIQTINNATAEPSEIMYVNLSGGFGGTISDAQGVGTINDND